MERYEWEVTHVGPSPLDYGGKFYGISRRFVLKHPDAGRAEPPDAPLFPDEETVGWLDVFEVDGPGRPLVYVAYLVVRYDFRDLGLGSRLIDHLYLVYPTRRIEWGALVGDRTPGMYLRRRAASPDQTGNGAVWR